MLHDLLQGLTAQTADGGAAPGGPMAALGSLLFPILIIVIFYLLVFRPQSKQQKLHQQFLAGLKAGDDVVLQSGLFGRVVKVEDTSVQLEIARDVRVRVLKSAVAGAQPGARAEPKPEEKK